MKGKPEVIAALNELLIEHRASVIKDMTHAAICGKWGYAALSDFFGHSAHEETEVIRRLMHRVVFLDSIPTLVTLGDYNTCNNVEEMLAQTNDDSLFAIAGFTKAIEVAGSFHDFGTMQFLGKMIVEEEKHLAEIEARMIQFSERGTI